WSQSTGLLFTATPVVVASRNAIIANSNDQFVKAFDERTGALVWSASGQYTGQPVAAGGHVWLQRTTGEIDAFSAAGTQGCGGSPRVCTPLWTSIAPATPVGVAVGRGHL